MKLSELIERVEGMEGPDREVDCEIAIALDLWPDWWRPKEGESLYVRPSNIGPDIAVQRAGKRKSLGDTPVWYTHEIYRNDTRLPCYTASLDAAIALTERVLPGWSWECRASGTGDKGQATVWNPLKAPGHNDEQRTYNCPSPAVALILATLRALSTQERDDGR